MKRRKVELESVTANTNGKIKLEEIFSPTTAYVEKLFEATFLAAMKIETLPEKYASSNYANTPKIKELTAMAGKVNELIDSGEENWSILFEGKTKPELVNYRRKIRGISDTNEAWANLCRNKEYYWALAEGCNWLIPLMHKYLYDSKV